MLHILLRKRERKQEFEAVNRGGVRTSECQTVPENVCLFVKGGGVGGGEVTGGTSDCITCGR